VSQLEPTNNTTTEAIHRLLAATAILEARLREQEHKNIKQEQEIEYLKKHLEKLEVEFVKNLENVRSSWSKFTWLVGGVVVSAIITWIIRGGLTTNAVI
jgi:flagellar motor switch protein FliM